MLRVGNYYYLVSTTMHLMPGCPVMRSKDLVHWETISYVFQRLTDLPRYDLKEGTVYGRGQWASSIRYHDGKLIQRRFTAFAYCPDGLLRIRQMLRHIAVIL